MASNAYAESARQRKALAIAEVLAAKGFTAATVAGFPESTWIYWADIARQNRPSEETQALVVKMLRDREKAAVQFGEREVSV